MSNYINVLRRLERDRRIPESTPLPVAPSTQALERLPLKSGPEAHEATVISAPELLPPAPVQPRIVISLPTPAAVPTVVPIPVPVPPTAAVTTLPATAPAPFAPDTRRSRAFATEAHPGIATLLDNLRILATGRTTRTVVFCGASSGEAVTGLADALATHAERSGMKTVIGTLTRTAGGTLVAPTHGTLAGAPALAVDLESAASSTDLERWTREAAPATDLLIITGPPLATSIDAALMACKCDGLVIVAESEKTERTALQIAAERARIAGCRTLGVVMYGTKDHLPGWIRRIMGDHAGDRTATPSPRED